MVSAKEVPICNYINLLSAILRTPREGIAKKLGVKLPVKGYPCRGCGVSLPRGAVNAVRYCPDCRFVPIACEVCGKIRKVPRAEALRQKGCKAGHPRFCSKRCQGVWLGAHYGWGKT